MTRTLLFLLLAIPCMAEEVQLWPNGSVEMEAFRLPGTQQQAPAVILCTTQKTEREKAWAEWLVKNDMHAFVLVISDGDAKKVQRAIRVVRKNAADWQIDAEAVGIWADASVAEVFFTVVASGRKSMYDTVDKADKKSPVADFAVLLNPAERFREQEFSSGKRPDLFLILPSDVDGVDWNPFCERYGDGQEYLPVHVQTSDWQPPLLKWLGDYKQSVF